MVLKNIDKDDIEVPTIPSTTAKLARALEKLDLEALQKKLESGLDGLDKLVNNPDLTARVIFFGGCRRSPCPVFLRLTPIQDQVISRRSSPVQNPVIGIGPVKLADYLDQSQIVTRTRD